MNSVNAFDINKSNLRTGADYVFDEFVKIMRKDKRSAFNIDVYPDTEQSSEINKELTQKRAEEIRQYFKEHQVRNKLTITTHEHLDPSNLPDEGYYAKGNHYKGSIYLEITDLYVRG